MAIPEIVNKPWGFEKIWAKTDKYVGKILHINPGQRLSLQYHNVKDETIYVLSGNLRLVLNECETETFMPEGTSYRIKPGVVHRFEAPPLMSVILLEVSTPELDDVVRLRDDYERS
ncbi:MAG: cupin [Euryarchaeota archaeon]|nr:cupin [Euryarchaeota archaeon]